MVDFDEPDELGAQDREAEKAIAILRQVVRDVKAAEKKDLGYQGWAEQYRSAAALTQKAATELARAEASFAMAAAVARMAGVAEESLVAAPEAFDRARKKCPSGPSRSIPGGKEV